VAAKSKHSGFDDRERRRLDPAINFAAISLYHLSIGDACN
jgi:hypothetical protein